MTHSLAPGARVARCFKRWPLLTAALGLGLVFAMMAQGPAHPAYAAGDCTVAAGEVGIDGEEQALLNGINSYRQQRGLQPLAASGSLNRAAAWMSHDMAAYRYFSHTDRLGRAFNVRLADCGYTYATYMGENIAAGNADAASTLTQWKNSPGHNALLLNSSMRAVGIARYYDAGAPYRWYWTLDAGGFNDGGSTGGTPTPTPTATPRPTATPPSGAKAVLTSPAPGSTLPGSTATFAWSAGTSVSHYWLSVGTTGAGSANLYSQLAGAGGTARSATVGGLPTNGATVYVRLYSMIGGAWQTADYTFRAAGGAATPTPAPTPTPTATPRPYWCIYLPQYC
jgi:uncharacterized protein YkwD